jgi:hypothetical protein
MQFFFKNYVLFERLSFFELVPNLHMYFIVEYTRKKKKHIYIVYEMKFFEKTYRLNLLVAH